MPPSSTAYSTTIETRAGCRAVLLVAAAAATTAGGAAILSLSPALPLRLAGALLWFLYGACELRSLWRGFCAASAYCLHDDGTVVVFGPQTVLRRGRLAAGSVLAGRLAWLVVAFDDGSRQVELIAANPRKYKAWRRLRVIFRHVTAC